MTNFLRATGQGFASNFPGANNLPVTISARRVCAQGKIRDFPSLARGLFHLFAGYMNTNRLTH